MTTFTHQTEVSQAVREMILSRHMTLFGRSWAVVGDGAAMDQAVDWMTEHYLMTERILNGSDSGPRQEGSTGSNGERPTSADEHGDSEGAAPALQEPGQEEPQSGSQAPASSAPYQSLTTQEVLSELYDRSNQANLELQQLAEGCKSERSASRIRAKAEGVRLVCSYIFEALHGYRS